MMMVSVVIPNFNKSKFITDTINSVISQQYQNFEIIIVDDGSTDDSVTICESLSQKDNRIRFVISDALASGASYCRNLGLSLAKGTYVLFLDSDDVITDVCLENRITSFEHCDSLDFIIFPTGTFYKSVGDSESRWIPRKSDDYLSKFLSHDLPWNISAPLWRRTFLNKLGGFDSSFKRLQDVELHSRALMYPNVRFKVVVEHPIDFYYRIDQDRLLYDYPIFLENFVKGILTYTDRMYFYLNQLPKVNQRKYIKALRGSIFTALTQILYYKILHKITEEQSRSLIKKLLDETAIIYTILSGRVLNFLNLYINAYEIGFYKIKGFNYLSKKVIMNL